MYTKDQLLAGDISSGWHTKRMAIQGDRARPVRSDSRFSLGKQWLSGKAKEGADKGRIAPAIERGILLRVINDLSDHRISHAVCLRKVTPRLFCFLVETMNLVAFPNVPGLRRIWQKSTYGIC